MARRHRVDLLIATSHGGHLELLLALRQAWAGHQRVWLTAPSAQAERLEREGERVVYAVNPERRPWLLARNAATAARAVATVRPRVVLTAGANVAVPACLIARATGARLVYVETMARVDEPSLSARLLRRVADAVLVQWPGLLTHLPGAELCRPALLERIGEPAPDARGTFVMAGTHGQPFARLLELVDRARAEGALPEPVRVQAGGHDVLAPDEVERAARGAEVLIGHGGSGFVSLALRCGRTPLVLPRRAARGEHVDDHQVRMLDELERAGLAVSLERTPLADAIEHGRCPPAPRTWDAPRLVDRVGALLA